MVFVIVGFKDIKKTVQNSSNGFCLKNQKTNLTLIPSNNQNKCNVFLLHLCNKIKIMKKNIFIAILCVVLVACVSNNIYLRNKESLEIENLERQVEYEKTMHSIDSTEQMRIIENYESLIQIIQK